MTFLGHTDTSSEFAATVVWIFGAAVVGFIIWLATVHVINKAKGNALGTDEWVRLLPTPIVITIVVVSLFVSTLICGGVGVL